MRNDAKKAKADKRVGKTPCKFLCVIGVILYTAKLSSGKTFTVFKVFQPIEKVFPLNHLLCTVHDGHGLMHHESFPVK